MTCASLRIAVVVIALLVAPATAVAQQKQHTATGTGGAAATVDLLATEAAIDTLREGGNAVDAAVAAVGVLGVTEPFSCGIGGGGFKAIRTRDGRVTTIDSREEAPAGMNPGSLVERGVALPFNDARWSGLSAGVPGTVDGWQRALRRYGTWSLGQALRRDRDRPGRLRGRRDVRVPNHARGRLVRRRPLHRGALPRPGRHAA